MTYFARSTGLEPATSPVTGECSNQLSYDRIYYTSLMYQKIHKKQEKNRCDLPPVKDWNDSLPKLPYGNDDSSTHSVFPTLPYVSWLAYSHEARECAARSRNLGMSKGVYLFISQSIRLVRVLFVGLFSTLSIRPNLSPLGDDGLCLWCRGHHRCGRISRAPTYLFFSLCTSQDRQCKDD